MFDKLIESRSGADLRPRRRYFVISSVVVGVLFVTAVIASLYAADIDLGVDEFDMAQMLAPVTAEEPEPVQQAPQRTTATQATELPHRQTNMLRVDESPITPVQVSVTPNTQLARPDSPFLLARGIESNQMGERTGDAQIGTGNSQGSGSSVGSPEPIRNTEPQPEPPPARPPQPPAIKSMGVVNGIAKSLPKPNYPAAALSMNIQGKVDVQVTIDEDGKVISAKAANGHILLRQAAERAAWNARFTPTTLSKIPVKVTGVIVYNFTRN